MEVNAFVQSRLIDESARRAPRTPTRGRGRHGVGTRRETPWCLPPTDKSQQHRLPWRAATETEAVRGWRRMLESGPRRALGYGSCMNECVRARGESRPMPMDTITKAAGVQVAWLAWACRRCGGGS